MAHRCGERLQFVSDGHEVPIIVDPDPLEESRDQLSLYGAWHRREEGIGSSHQIEVAQHHLGALFERLGGGIETGPHLMLLDLQIPQASSELVGCEGTLGSEIDQAFFLDVELLEFLLQTSPLLRLVREYPFEGGADFTLGLGDAGGGEDDCPKLALKRTLKLGNGKVRQVADAVLAAAAEEVLIGVAGVILGFGEDEAMFSPCRVASPAVKQATCEVIVDAIALSPLHASIDHLLDPVEQFWRDEWFMASRIDVAFEGHHAEVVRIAENLAELAP